MDVTSRYGVTSVCSIQARMSAYMRKARIPRKLAVSGRGPNAVQGWSGQSPSDVKKSFQWFGRTTLLPIRSDYVLL